MPRGVFKAAARLSTAFLPVRGLAADPVDVQPLQRQLEQLQKQSRQQIKALAVQIERLQRRRAASEIESPLLPSLSRRRFVQNSALSGALAVLAASLSPALSIAAAERNGIETAASPHSKLSGLHVQATATGWSVGGRLRLLPDPLRHSNPGRVVLEAVAPDGRVLAASSTTIHRVVTANPRARLFGFGGALTGEFPAGVVLCVQHVPALP